MSDIELEQDWQRDSDFHTPLERVNFEAGMLLGVEATRAEQAYHRLRANRQHYWLHGAGTLLGFGVRLDPATAADNSSDISLKLVVGPGIGVDGLGREVMSHEPYCVNLLDWFEAQREAPQGEALLQDGLEAGGEVLSLLITMRYQACATGLQPVLARKVNAGTDPVQASRARDSLLLEIIPAPLPPAPRQWPWAGLQLQAVEPQTTFTEAERSYLAGLSNAAERKLRTRQGQLLYGLPNHNRALEIDGEPQALARTLLAHLRVPLRADRLPAISPVVNPQVIEVNNLIRPFINTAEQLAWLSREE